MLLERAVSRVVVRYICGSCGFVLYEFRYDRKNAVAMRTPAEIISKYKGVCPRCGKRLEFRIEEWRERIRVEKSRTGVKKR
ncbi:MAG: hypothetical protein QXM08_03590 [Thermofilaceae archaeon]